jgi:hypothetical protein
VLLFNELWNQPEEGLPNNHRSSERLSICANLKDAGRLSSSLYVYQIVIKERRRRSRLYVPALIAGIGQKHWRRRPQHAQMKNDRDIRSGPAASAACNAPADWQIVVLYGF